MHLALSFQQVSCTHSMSTPLRSIRSSISLSLLLSLIFLAFFLSSFLSFLLLHCFPPLCIQVACPLVTLGAQSLVTVVVFPGLDRSGMKSDFTTSIEKYLAMFYAGCPSCRNPPHLSGLGTGTKAALIQILEVLQNLCLKLRIIGRKKFQMGKKSRALTLLEKGESVVAVARDIGVSREAIYQLKRSATSLSPGMVPKQMSGSGAPKKTSPRTDKLLKREV